MGTFEAAPPGTGGAIDRSSRLDDLQESLRLVRQLGERLAHLADHEQARDFRMRLVRAHALSIVDLLVELVELAEAESAAEERAARSRRELPPRSRQGRG